MDQVHKIRIRKHAKKRAAHRFGLKLNKIGYLEMTAAAFDESSKHVEQLENGRTKRRFEFKGITMVAVVETAPQQIVTVYPENRPGVSQDITEAGMAVFIKHGEYKGKPTITLSHKENDQYGFTFGVTKAQMILDALDEIAAFVDANKEAPATSDEPA